MMVGALCNYKQQQPDSAARLRGGALGISRLVEILVATLLLALIHHPVLGSAAPDADTYSLTLSWGDSSPDPDLIGYRVYYGTASGEYTNIITTGNVSTATISGLLYGVTYYFAITAVDIDGDESDFSNEISYQQDAPTVRLQIQSVADGQFLLTVNGPPGKTYDIEATEDFTTWTVIGTGTLDADGSLEFTDTDAANHPQRFYRAHDPRTSVQALPAATLQILPLDEGQFLVSVNGPPGRTYDIEATQDFTTWTVIDMGTLDDRGWLDFTDTDAPNYPQRFYRARDTQSQ